MVGAYAGLRPLLDLAPDGAGSTADLSRKHAVLTSRTGVVTVVGGKLTTYRRMAEDAVDAAVAGRRPRRRPVPHPHPAAARRGAPAPSSPRLEAAGPAGPPLRHRRRAGARPRPARSAASADDELLAPVADGVPATLAELVFGVTHEGAADVDDLLDRRTRIGLVPADRALAVPAAERALALVRRRGRLTTVSTSHGIPTGSADSLVDQ